jgi:hypothetical protein
MTYTGGPLNELNGKRGISAPINSVPVMKLIKVHNPRSKEELVNLIKAHYEDECPCGIHSKGTIEDFGRKLFDSQIKYWGQQRFSLRECIQWEYDLFVVQSLKGHLVELNAIKLLSEGLIGCSIEAAEGYLDEELRIDVIIKAAGKELCGIQVKPSTFNHMRPEVISFNHAANTRWGYPVFYLFYNEIEEFTNLSKILSEVQKLHSKYSPAK